MIVKESWITKEFLLEMKHAGSSVEFQDAGNQMNILHEIRIRNANRLIIGQFGFSYLHL